MLNILYYLSFCLPVFLLVAEVVATIYLSRKRIKGRLLYVLVSYLLLVGLATFLALPGDEFGYSFISALLITEPWDFILARLHLTIPFLGNGLVQIVWLGATLNCAFFYILDRLSCPKHSDEVSSLLAT